MTRTAGLALAGLAATLGVTPLSAATDPVAALDVFRAAALSGDTRQAAALMADQLVLVSQSGKVYGKAEALADLGGGFIAWDNTDIAARNESGHTRVLSFVNRRQRPAMAAARFRVLQVWQARADRFRLIAQSSVKLPD